MFEGMFRHKFKENNEDKILLTDYDADLIQELLRFIYKGEVENIATFAAQLLPLADLVSTYLTRLQHLRQFHVWWV